MPAARALALFISDLHLQPSQPGTCEAFLDFLARRATQAQALYLLGDLFDAWPGDDDLDEPFHRAIVDALRRVSDAGVAVYWIAGNRDFLVGAEFARASGATMLAEPHVVTIGGRRIVLMHGDAVCTDDIKYMQFRQQVRQPAWQAQFLALPLAQRKTIIADLRKDSRAEQGEKSYEILDVTPQAVALVLAQTGAEVMIHGHTHRPALHCEGAALRYVLPDWDVDAEPARGGWIAVETDGAIRRHGIDGATLDDA